jgi:hypothetical protein
MHKMHEMAGCIRWVSSQREVFTSPIQTNLNEIALVPLEENERKHRQINATRLIVSLFHCLTVLLFYSRMQNAYC